MEEKNDFINELEKSDNDINNGVDVKESVKDVVNNTDKINDANNNDANNEDNAEHNESELLLPEVIEVCEKYLSGKMSDDEMKQWFSAVKIVPYLSIYDKVAIIYDILFFREMNDSEELEWQMAELESAKLWKMLFAYTNIRVDGYEAYQTLYNYDIVYQVVGEYVLTQCLIDYNRFIRMLESTMNVYNIQKLVETFSMRNTEEDNKQMEDVKKQLEYFDKNKETLKMMSEVFSSTNNM